MSSQLQYFLGSDEIVIRMLYGIGLEDYIVEAEFKKTGKTEFILESPDGEKTIFDINIRRDTYSVEKIK